MSVSNCSTPNSNTNLFEQVFFYTNSSVYCGNEWRSFWLKYDLRVDLSLTTVIAGIGLFTNVVNILVFSQKEIRKSPLMRILLALAVADLCQSVRRLAHNAHVLFGEKIIYKLATGSYETLFLYVLNSTLLPAIHAWTVYLTLCAALWRWIGILHPLKSRKWLTNQMAKWLIIFSIVWATVVAAPALFIYKIEPVSPNPNHLNSTFNDSSENVSADFPEECDFLSVIQTYNNSVISITKEYFPNFFDVEMHTQLNEPNSNEEDQSLYKVVLRERGSAIFAVVNVAFIKVGPCFVLLIATIGLIVSLIKNKKKRHKLFEDKSQTAPKSQGSSTATSETSLSISMSILTKSQDDSFKTPQEMSNKAPNPSQSHGKTQDQSTRITLMLVIILLIFFVTEIPLGIFFIVTLIYGKIHFFECLLWPTTFNLMMELFSSATSFFVYIGMGESFRRGVVKLEQKARNVFRF